MQRFYDVVTDQFGNPANGVLVTVYDAGTTTPSTLYRDSDNALTATNVISNPFTTNASGIVAFAVANGQYTITYSGSSITPRTFTWLTLSDSSGGGGGTTTNALTMNNGGAGDVSGSTFNGSAAKTISYNTIGAAPTVSPTFTVSATFSFLTNTRVTFSGAAGALTDNANFTYTVGTGLKVNDSTASSSTTTGALIVTGGIGAGGNGYFGGNLNASGATNQFGGSALGQPTEVQILSSAGFRRGLRFMTGANGRWLVAAGAGTESGSDAGAPFQVISYTDAGSIIDNAIEITRASGGTITLGTTSRAVSIAKTANAAEWIHGSISELLTLSTAGTTTDTTANLLPANSIIEAVVARVTTTITTATSWQLGDPTTAGRFTNANSTMTAGTTDIGLKHQQGSVATDAAGPVQTAAAKVRVTTVGTPGAGAVRITVFYRQFVAPTS